MDAVQLLQDNSEYLIKKMKDANSNYQRIETQLENTKKEVLKLESQLLVAKGRKDAFYQAVQELPSSKE